MMKVYVRIFSLLNLLFLVACKSETTEVDYDIDNVQFIQNIQGKTQGTTYLIQLKDRNKSIQKTQIDSILHDFDIELSTYIKTSLISQFNNSQDGISIQGTKYFMRCFEASQEIAFMTDGDFDPTVFPLVKAWGFFKKNYNKPSDEEIDSILNYTGYQHVKLQGLDLLKKQPSLKLDFNAIAQGLAVDVLAEFLISKDHTNFFIEIGGEVRMEGLKKDNEPWFLGVDVPSKENLPGMNRTAQVVLKISENVSVATSGDYRKSFEVDGETYSHSIDPKTGWPVKHNLRSTTVIASNCMLADAYATAFTVMGVDMSLAFIQAHPDLNLKAYFISQDKNGHFLDTMSEEFGSYIHLKP